MEDIYGDLDNYNNVNVVEELKSENEELRTKLDENTVAMDKLQKEFNHLSAEFKKLEMNYSSLLKTAKAEIERKSQMITSLNKEKDMMVLNAIQNKNMTPRNVLKPYIPQNSKMKEKIHEKSDEALKKKHNPPRENVPNVRIPTMDTVFSSNTDISIKSQECQVSLPKDQDKNLEFKENCNLAKVASSKIRSRRKSMPAIRQEDLSSLSGEEDIFVAKDYRKDLQTQHDRQKKSSKKGSDTSSVDDKYSSYKDSLETYHRSWHTKHYESEKYQRNRDTYDSERYRRITSPDHLLRRATRNSRNNQYSSHRYSETNYKYGHRSRSRDSRVHYDKVYDDRQSFSNHMAYDTYYDRQAYFDRRDDQLSRRSYSDRLPGKHKTQSDYDSYSVKRMKMDVPDPRRDDNVYQMDNNYTDEELFQKVIGDIQYTSCQSPDFMQTEYTTQEPVKEIRLTSDICLEDPRLKCRNYSLKSDDCTVRLKITNKQNIDLMPIDPSSWNKIDVSVPDALKKLPDQVILDIKKNDKLETSAVTESAKSPSFNETLIETKSNDVNMVDLVKATETDKTNDLTTLQSKSNTNQITKEGNVTNIMPTLKHDSKQDSKHIEKERKSDKKYLSKQSKKSRKCSETSSVEQSTHITNFQSIKNSTNSIARNNLTSVDHASNILLSKNHTRLEKKLTNREIVAGDLELSDETSDNTDFDLKQKQKNQTIRKSNNPQSEKHKETSNISLETLIKDKSETCDKVKKSSNLDIDEKTDTNKQLSYNKNIENILLSVNSTKLPQSDETIRKSNNPQFEKHIETSNICLETLIKDKSETCDKVKKSSNLDIDEKTDTNKQLSNNKNIENILLSVNSTKLPQSDSKPDTDTKETQKSHNDNESKKTEKLSTSKNEKSVCTDVKNKDEVKKKTKKTKTSTSKKISETTELKSDQNKKSMKEKGRLSTPIKNKFTDLFGENSSLITPEDLGLTACQPELRASANYVPMSEDAQDAMDIVVSVEEIACDQKEIQKAVVDTGNPLSHKDSSHDKPTNNTEVLKCSKPKSGPDINDTENQKDLADILTIRPETGEPEFIKTIIISTGVQPQTDLKANLPIHAMEPNSLLVSNKATMDAVNSLQALATSTPHKSLFDVGQKNPDISNTSSDSRTSVNINIANDQSSKSMSEAQNDDAPDVRLVLKRKRRVIKK